MSTESQQRRELKSDLREAQHLLRPELSRGNLAKAFGILERAVCRHLGLQCRHCRLASTGDDLLCDHCRARLAESHTHECERLGLPFTPSPDHPVT